MDTLATTSIRALTLIADNEPTSLYPLQTWLLPYTDALVVFWWTVWVFLVVFLIANYIIKPAFIHHNPTPHDNHRKKINSSQ